MRTERLFVTVTKAVLALDLIIGLVLLLAGMGEPGPGVSTPLAVQMLPLSGFVVIAAGLFGMGAAERQTRSDGAKLVAVALVFVAVAAWISLVRIQTQGIGTVLVIGALAPFLAGLRRVV